MVNFCIIWQSNGQYQRTLHFWYGLCCLAVSCMEWSYAHIFIQIDKYHGDASGAGRHANGSRGGTAHFGRAPGSQRKEREEKDSALFSLPQRALHRSQVRPDLLHLQRRRVVSLKNVSTGENDTENSISPWTNSNFQEREEQNEIDHGQGSAIFTLWQERKEAVRDRRTVRSIDRTAL